METKLTRFACLLCLITVFAAFKNVSRADDLQTHGFYVHKLTVNYADRPLGIDSGNIQLGWIIASNSRGELQKAYQIIAATTLPKLNAKPDLWNTGKVFSSNSIQVRYTGKGITSYARVYWKVRVWGSDGKVSLWSAPSWFEIGIGANNWKGKWISAIKELPPADPDFKGAHWIWPTASTTDTASPVRTATIIKVFNTVNFLSVRRITAAFCTKGGYTLYINRKPVWKAKNDSAQVVDIKRFLTGGKDTLKIEAVDDAAVKGLLGVVTFFANGRPISRMVTDTTWRSFAGNKLEKVFDIGLFDHRPIQWLPKLPSVQMSAPLLRRSFT